MVKYTMSTRPGQLHLHTGHVFAQYLDIAVFECLNCTVHGFGSGGSSVENLSLPHRKTGMVASHFQQSVSPTWYGVPGHSIPHLFRRLRIRLRILKISLLHLLHKATSRLSRSTSIRTGASSPSVLITSLPWTSIHGSPIDSSFCAPTVLVTKTSRAAIGFSVSSSDMRSTSGW